MKLRILEAIARANQNGKKVLKKDIAAKLWDGTGAQAQQVAMTNLCSGNTQRVKPEWVIVICDMTDCTPNYLFGYAD